MSSYKEADGISYPRLKDWKRRCTATATPNTATWNWRTAHSGPSRLASASGATCKEQAGQLHQTAAARYQTIEAMSFFLGGRRRGVVRVANRRLNWRSAENKTETGGAKSLTNRRLCPTAMQLNPFKHETRHSVQLDGFN